MSNIGKSGGGVISGSSGGTDTSSGDAVAADVLEGKTFSNKDDVSIPGTVPAGVSVNGANGSKNFITMAWENFYI